MSDEERELLGELLAQMADDDFVAAERAAEWLGLAPHLEEDVAFASIAQDEMGHAATYYRLLSDLGLGTPDDLAHLRPADARRNSVMLERPNGSGTYLFDPHFDWAYALARHFLYDVFEHCRLDRASHSSHQPLAEAAIKIRREERYHLVHHETWIAQVAARGGDAAARFQAGLARAAKDAGDLAWTEPWSGRWTATGLLPRAESMAHDFRVDAAQRLAPFGLPFPPLGMTRNGRLGQHSDALEVLLKTVSEVVREEPGASW